MKLYEPSAFHFLTGSIVKTHSRRESLAQMCLTPNLEVEPTVLAQVALLPLLEPPRGKTNNVVSEANRSDTNRPVQSQKMARGLNGVK